MHTWQRIDSFIGALAAAVWVAAVVGFAAALPGFRALAHPVALLGATGVPHGQAFSWLGFVLPGVMASVVALRLLLRVPRTSPWTLRVGVQLLVLAGFGFAAMGLLPLDASDIQSPASQFHASAWMVWVLAFVPGALLYGLGALRVPGWRAPALLHLGCAVGMLLAAFVLQAWMPAPLAQGLAFACWAVWLVVALPLAAR
ncbi:DUF998 domain-containing protein [Bacillus subtilis subsp. subtilis]|nr:DUF998 domain-containing protein [Bacillus subtilis subsp. subtilis]